MSETKAEYSADGNGSWEIKDSSRNNFTIIPNIIFKIGLSVYAVRLYCELKMIAGEEGKCWASTDTLSSRCNMSTGSISTYKQELVDKGLINIETKDFNNKHYHEITIIDIWEKNFSYRADSPHELAGSRDELAGSPHERIKNHINKNPKTRDSESYKKDIQESCDKGMTRKSGGLEDYPERIKEVLLEFVNLWKMKLPAKSQKGYWITGGEDLKDACGELGVEVLRQVRNDFADYMINHHGIAPYTVSSPNSLVNPARAKAGWMRDNQTRVQTIIPQGASEIWIGGQRYAG